MENGYQENCCRVSCDGRNCSRPVGGSSWEAFCVNNVLLFSCRDFAFSYAQTIVYRLTPYLNNFPGLKNVSGVYFRVDSFQCCSGFYLIFFRVRIWLAEFTSVFY